MLWIVFGKHGVWGTDPLTRIRDSMQLWFTGGEYLHADLVVDNMRCGIANGEHPVVEPWEGVFKFMSDDRSHWVRLDPALFDESKIIEYTNQMQALAYSNSAALQSCFKKPLDPARNISEARAEDRNLRPFCSAFVLSALRRACVDERLLMDVCADAITPYRLMLLVTARGLVDRDTPIVAGSKIKEYIQ